MTLEHVFCSALVYLPAQMLRICSLAGETLATFGADEVEGKRVELLKIALAKQIGVTRFRQRWLTEDHTELHDDAVVPCCDVQLVVLSFVQTKKKTLWKLLSACRENHPDKLVDLLRKPLNPEGDHERPVFLAGLHLAAEYGHPHIVQLLLEAGTYVDIADDGDEDDDRDLCWNDYLRSFGYFLDHKRGGTALHFAAMNGHSNVVKLLLEAGADKDAVDRDWMTPLHWAARIGDLESVKLLLEAGANKNATNEYFVTALHYAAKFGHLEVVKLLLEADADKHAVDSSGKTCLDCAIWSGQFKVVRLLLGLREVLPILILFALHVAALTGHSEVVKLFCWRLGIE